MSASGLLEAFECVSFYPFKPTKCVHEPVDNLLDNYSTLVTMRL